MSLTELLKEGRLTDISKEVGDIMDKVILSALNSKIEKAKKSAGIKLASAAIQGK
jgi:hypothetical protein